MLRFTSIKQFVRFRKNLFREYYENYFESPERDDLSWRLLNSYLHKNTFKVSKISARQTGHLGGTRSKILAVQSEQAKK